ncbi:MULTISPECIES: pPIWI-associating nuclease domain-containing protein [Olivibacter]|uniref:Uncharacterized protein n=1 Tax=Olivibacter oleidegradans TaxID=760123 RepID=A0ABV6HIL7_9SPHI|nr:hypothetical protein [Olivibacter jilunii]
MENQEKIKELLTTDFERELFSASIDTLNDTTNKLRLNNFAYSIRELSRHFLHNLSPDDNVKACAWFKKETADGNPTRHQRIKYAIQGGITDESLSDWGFDTEALSEIIGEVKSAISILNKYTHVNPEVFGMADKDIEDLSQDVLQAFINLVDTIEAYRNDLKQFLDGHIDDHMLSSIVNNFFQNVDMLAPHHYVDYSEVSDYHIIEINSTEIIVEVSGNLNVTLEYGSSKERREGDGLDLHESFPFDTAIRYVISPEFPFSKYTIDDYDVDTSSWYE